MASVPSSARSLVLGFASRLPPATIEPFLVSLHRSGYRGRIGLVLGGYDASETKRLHGQVDFTSSVDACYPPPQPAVLVGALQRMRHQRGLRRTYPWAFAGVAWLGRERSSLGRWKRLEFTLEGLQSLRYGHYYDVLRREASDAEEILITDVRDVLFQDDPFADAPAGLEVFLEEPTETVGHSHFNTLWLRQLYGRRAVREMAGWAISCSGTVVGRRDAVMNYLKEMQSEIIWRRQPMGNHDQGVHNRLLFTGRLPEATIIANGRGRVLTMGAMTSVRRDTDGSILNPDGSRPAILHQYDRHPALAAELLSRFQAPRSARS